MDTSTLIKYALAIQGISSLQAAFEPPDGRVIIRYTDRAGPQTATITFAELSDLFTTSNPQAPAAPPG